MTGDDDETEDTVQTLLAYARTRAGTETAAEGAARVGRYYAPLAGGRLQHDGVDDGERGLHLWEAHAGERLWPAWQREGELAVATLHTPIGYERVVGDRPPEQAAVPLARRLTADPESVFRLAAPFVLAALDPGQLVLFTDVVGLGRLFELRVADGWVWTNRPAAAYLFAGLPLETDAASWRYVAAVDWFMGDSAPLRGLTAIDAGSCVRVDASGRRTSRVDPARHWLAEPGDPLGPAALDEVAESLQVTARSAARLWTSTPRIGLSGGRDSRVVTAAFLSAGVDVDLHTNAQPGEAEIATELVSRWGRGVRHEVKPIASIAAPAPHALGAADRALGWMRRSEGLGPSSYLSRMPPSTHARSARLLVSGIGGELAHGHYYPPDLAAVEALPVHEQVAACATHLKRRLIARRGPTPAGQAAAVLRTDEVLAAALGAGAPPLVALDVFYLVERLRRWGTGADQADIVLPLLTPDLVGAALRLTPRQRRENALPRALVARLVPAWADVPFLCDLPRRPAPMRAPAPRLWQVDEQRELLAAAIDASGPWADAFDVRQVQEMWHQAVVGGASSTDEAVLQRVLWRAAFEEYVAEANGTPLTRPRPIAVAAVGQGAGHTPLPLRLAGWKGRLRRQPVLRRAATSRWGRRLRGLRR